ncbi:hypothetical protein [Roseiterribacter gracilis]|uniref:Uncharacterized protein n=1 Tax=Roseiterribacter gracilis TaxID=2812848 RepID=A0A8S8XAQ0_9PROT|nr:hypothetical protein TMPK1_20710 [Rhodospirillales bacterium TMPK1]
MRALIKKFARAIAGREIDLLRQSAADAAAAREFIEQLRRDLTPLTHATVHPPAPGDAGLIEQLNYRFALLDQRGGVLEHHAVMLHKELDELRKDVQILARTLTLPPTDLWYDGTGVAAAKEPPIGVLPSSMICRQREMDTDWYAYWTGRMAHKPRYHRKMWEFVFIAQALYERGQLAPGKRGLGFGVGKEPLAALFATFGADTVGTDMPFEGAIEAGWATDNQHAAGKAQMRWPTICPDDKFDAHVSFETFDMTKTPGAFRDFDFCWSSCALEHLGSIDAGLSFIERSIETLKVGGVAVHTTEYNLISNDETVETGGTVLFRKRDFEAVIERLEKAGHKVAPLDLRPGAQPVERYVDIAPFRDEPHLRLALMGYATTSMGLIVTRGR